MISPSFTEALLDLAQRRLQLLDVNFWSSNASTFLDPALGRLVHDDVLDRQVCPRVRYCVHTNRERKYVNFWSANPSTCTVKTITQLENFLL